MYKNDFRNKDFLNLTLCFSKYSIIYLDMNFYPRLNKNIENVTFKFYTYFDLFFTFIF